MITGLAPGWALMSRRRCTETTEWRPTYETAPYHGEPRHADCALTEQPRLTRQFEGLADRWGTSPSTAGASIEDRHAVDADRVRDCRPNRPRPAIIVPLAAVMVRLMPTIVDWTSVTLLTFDASAVTVIVSKVRRPFVAKVSARMRRHRNHQWVRMLSASSSRRPVQDGSAPSQSSAGAVVRPTAVSAVPNSERWRVKL
jgi:hypothetical protein